MEIFQFEAHKTFREEATNQEPEAPASERQNSPENFGITQNVRTDSRKSEKERRKPKPKKKEKKRKAQKGKSGKLLGRVAAESLWSSDPWAGGPSGKVLAVEDINLSLDDIQFRHSAETSGTKPPASSSTHSRTYNGGSH